MTDPAAVYAFLTDVRTEPLAVATALPGPSVIGATGGSGTRVVAGIVRGNGLFVGSRLNPYEDAVAFGEYSDRWINPFVERAGGAPGAELVQRMRADLDRVVRDHLADITPGARAWGWKEPRSIYLLPFYDAAIPSLRFLHFIRDGRDMAFSENQNQLVKHGDAVLDGELRKERKPVKSIALWSRVNSAAADYGETRLGERYLRVRFEDLCAEPEEIVRRILEFFGLDGDAAAAAAAVRPPDTLGRWREHRRGVVDALHRVAGPALERFGYS